MKTSLLRVLLFTLLALGATRETSVHSHVERESRTYEVQVSTSKTSSAAGRGKPPSKGAAGRPTLGR